MRVLVTGSEGSLMQATIPHLIREGHTVKGVDSLFRYGAVERRREYEFVRGDLSDWLTAKEACAGADVVIQAAARIFGVRGFHEYPADILGYDVQLHHNILRGSLAAEVPKVVYISSSMVYERAERTPSSEEDVADMPVPLTDYGLSKMVCERLSQATWNQHGLRYTIWRPFNIITPYEQAEDRPGMAHVFADFIRNIILEKQNPLKIFGDGEQVRCFTWIDDVAAAIVAYLSDERADNEAYNLGNPEPVTMKALAQRIHAKAVEWGLLPPGELGFEHLPAYSDDVRVRIPAISKAQRKLGWGPTVSLDQALDVCLDAPALKDQHH